MTLKLIKTPVSDKVIRQLHSGDRVYISGYLYTGRDSAHKKLIELIKEGKKLPIEIKGQFFYYVGPTPARPGKPIGSAGPTTSCRMDPYTPLLHKLGLKGTIGKGFRSKEVKESLKRYKAVYLATSGGTGALISRSIEKAEVIAYPELGPEAIRLIKVKDFPCIISCPPSGPKATSTAKKQYQK